MSAKLTAFAMLGALLLGSGHAQDGARESGKLFIFFPCDAATAELKRWVSSARDHGPNLVLVALNPAAMTEEKLIEIAQGVQAAHKGRSFSIATEDSLGLLRDRGVRRLPAFVFVAPGKVHVWQGDGRWETILSCGSSKSPSRVWR